MPALGLGVFQTPPEDTTAAVETALPPVTAIDTAAAYGNEREVGEGIRRSGSRPRRGVPRDEGLDQRLRLRRDAARVRQERRQARRRAARPADPAPAAADRFDRTLDAYRALETLLADGKVRAIGVSNFMPDHLERCWRRPCRAGRQPDRAAPVLHAGRASRAGRPARHPHPGVVADRWHHVLPRRHAKQHVRRPDHPRDRRRARQDGCPGDAALASAAGPIGDPEVGPARSASPRTSTSSTSSSSTEELVRSTRSTRAYAAARSPRRSPSRTSAGRFPRHEQPATSQHDQRSDNTRERSSPAPRRASARRRPARSRVDGYRVALLARRLDRISAGR